MAVVVMVVVVVVMLLLLVVNRKYIKIIFIKTVNINDIYFTYYIIQ